MCQRLSVTHFVDDRLDVLGALPTVSHRLLFTGSWDHAAGEIPPGVVVVADWSQCAAVLRATISALP